MGARIAAHLANVGIPVVLLDLPRPEGARSALAIEAVETLKRAKPGAFFDVALAEGITPGNFEDDLALVGDCDWVIEAVTENLAIKQALVDKVAPHLKRGAIFTTNTSGLPVASIGSRLPEPLRRRWFGTHFFNPPRYMRLVEIIATPETDPEAVETVAEFADRRLGKEIVYARDTPNFIANRIGVFAMLEAMRLMQEEDFTVEEVDELTGALIGWPRTATLRLADLVGLDVLAHVAANFPPSPGFELVIPPFLGAMLERRWLGDKTGQGFYSKEKDSSGNEVRLTLDWKRLEYRAAVRPGLASVETAKKADRLADRLRQLLEGDAGSDRAARFHWRLLAALWNYTAGCLPEIAGDVSSVDRAMRAGFNWEMGPFEMWDAAGVRVTVRRMEATALAVSSVVKRLLAAGAETWYRNNGRDGFDVEAVAYRRIVRPAGVARVADFRASNGVIRQMPGLALVDLGEGVACIELDSKKNTIGEDAIRMMIDVLRPEGDAVRNFSAFVVSGDGDHFSTGANLAVLLRRAQEGDWQAIEQSLRELQRMTWAFRFCPRPVVAAPFGQCLGSGAELALHAARRQAHAELYMGLTETGVGLLPAGGSLKEMTMQALETAAAAPPGLLEVMRRNLETIVRAKVTTSAVEARRLGFLADGDRVTMNRARLLIDARELALGIAGAGYTPPVPRTDIPAPGEHLLEALRSEAGRICGGGRLSDYGANVAGRVAYVLCGGQASPGTPVSEQHLLDLEREAFLSLCGEKETQERIAYTLTTGKTLRK